MNPLDPVALKELVHLIVNQVFSTLTVLFIMALVFYALQLFVLSILSYFNARFSDVGCGTILEVDKERYRVNDISFNNVKLGSLDRPGIHLRIPLKKWNETQLMICYDLAKKGKTCLSEDEYTH